jgi:putative ABC transport system ATP-binding protein
METAIVCEGITKSYGDDDNKTEVLKDINLTVRTNELTLLVGPSGSGKTTLLSIITTILTPDSGKLLLLGQDPSKMNDAQKAAFCRNNIGIVFQSFFLVPTLSVIENVTVPLLVAGHTQEESMAKAGEALETFHMSHKANLSPSHLSKGQQQRIAIARAMVNKPKIIVCDEPTSSLDHTSGGEIMDLLHKLAIHDDRCVLVVTHDNRTFPYADRVIEMADGVLIPGKVQ